ncbi:MAG: hypothetical protein LBS15_03465 [Endomicrobium sp.]|jgi:hypothetical protein|nr:hypothetical protein [Endomicrobium sp.]
MDLRKLGNLCVNFAAVGKRDRSCGLIMYVINGVLAAKYKKNYLEYGY